MIDQHGLDTELARLLHRLQRVDVGTLRGTLAEVRRTRPDAGPTLARLLVGRGVVTAAELEPLLGGLTPGGGVDRRISSSSERLDPALLRELREQFAGDDEETRVNRPSLTSSGLEQGNYDPTEVTRPKPSPVRRPSASWEVRPAEGAQARPARPENETAGGWMPGSFVGEYVLEKQAGAGGMGLVFVGRHLETGRRVAIKTLRSNADEEMVARFRREGAAQVRVDGHPNVARVLGTGEAHGRLYIIMELAEGGDLVTRLRRGLPSFVDAATIVAGVARGLAHMHGCGVLHRDLKPANILFDAAGAPKLVDFGLARFDDARRLTLTGEVMGTPAFMAPEQTSGRREDTGPWCDVWSLGAVLFYTLTGNAPYQGGGALEVMTQVAEQPPPPVRSQRPDTPPELAELVARIMSHDVESRPTAAQVAIALERYVARQFGGRTSVDVPPPPGGRRHVVAWLGLLAAASVVAAVSALTFVRGRSTGSPPATDTAPTAPPSPVTQPPPEPPPAPLAPAVFRWEVGETQRWRMTYTADGRFERARGMGMGFVIDLTLDLALTAVTREQDRLAAEGRIEALRFRWKTEALQAAGGISPYNQEVAFDSRSTADDHPEFRPAVGAKLYLVVSARTGEVELLDGMDAVQRQIYESAGQAQPQPALDAVEDGARDERRVTQMVQVMRYRLPMIGEVDGLKTLVVNLIDVLPDDVADDPRAWTKRRYGVGQLQSAVWVDVTAARDDAWRLITWKGNRTAMLPEVRVSRGIEGQATLDARGLVRAEVTEKFGGVQQGTATTTLEVLR